MQIPQMWPTKTGPLCNAERQGQVGSEQNIYYFALEIQLFFSLQGSSQSSDPFPKAE